MESWSAGYAAEVDYTHGYFKELNPLNVKLALLDAGIALPQNISACELGFGQGLSVNIHAAASDTLWFGTDFSPTQAGFAQQMAKTCENQAWLFDQSFAEFAARNDLPEFDYIALHGTWTWVSDENRRILVDFISRKLKVGGVLYISYNTQAGWANMIPIRHLLNEHAKTMAAQGADPVERIQSAFIFTEQLLATNPTYLKANPQVRKNFDLIKTQNPNYLAHEYFSADWKPMPFAEMHSWLSSAKLDYVCSANTLDQVNALNLTESQEALINAQPNPTFRETLRDLSTNQQFRKDYWVKGARRLDQFEQMEQLMALRFVLGTPREEIELTAIGTLGEVRLKAETYQPLLDFFADYQIKSLQQLMIAMQPNGIGFDKIMQAMLILTGNGTLHPANEDVAIESARAKTAKLNRFLLNKARASDEISYLASPVTGGGIATQGYEMLFLLAMQFGHNTPEVIAPFVWGLLKQRGIRLNQRGQLLESDTDNIEELQNQVRVFLGEPLKVYRALGIAT